MYAVIRTGGKQYRVAKEDVIKIEKVGGDVGETVQFQEVLMLGGDKDISVGEPLVSGASVAGEILEQGRASKIIVFKKKRRKNYRRTKGHRQEQTTIKITDILTDGKAPKKTAAKTKKDDSADKDKTPAKKETAAKPAAGQAFGLLDKPQGDADDLKKISGVGPVLEEKLNNFGIWHYWQVAALDAENIAKIDEELNFKGRIERDDWMSQAKKLMED